MENFKNPISVILIAAAIISIITGVFIPEGLIVGTLIMSIVVIIFVVKSANNYGSEKKL